MNSFNAQVQNSISFSIKKTTSSVRGFSFSFEASGNNQWNNMKLTFVVTDRPDIELGRAVYDAASADSQAGVLRYTLRSNWSDVQRLQLVPFLTEFSGESASGSIGYLINSHYATGTVLSINYQAQSNTRINKLAVDLVLFDPLSQSLRFQHRQITDTFLSSLQIGYLPAPLEREQRLELFGLTAFVVETNTQLSLSSSLGQNQTYSYIKYGPLNEGCFFNYLALSYLVVAFNPCGFCAGTFYIYQGKCYQQCPLGTRPSNGTCESIVCQAGTYLLDSSCKNCPKRSNIPACNNSCAVDEILRGEDCFKICDSLLFLSYRNGLCICQEGYFNISGSCGQCPAGTLFNSSTSSCLSICNPNERYNPQLRRCVCLDGYYLIGTVCGVCP
jgi:hypothetical protein